MEDFRSVCPASDLSSTSYPLSSTSYPLFCSDLSSTSYPLSSDLSSTTYPLFCDLSSTSYPLSSTSYPLFCDLSSTSYPLSSDLSSTSYPLSSDLSSTSYPLSCSEFGALLIDVFLQRPCVSVVALFPSVRGLFWPYESRRYITRCLLSSLSQLPASSNNSTEFDDPALIENIENHVGLGVTSISVLQNFSFTKQSACTHVDCNRHCN